MYLIIGESFRLVEEEIQKIINDCDNVITMDLNLFSIEDIIKEATYVSMFGEKKYIVVKNAYFFTSTKTKEEDLEILFHYIENPINLTTILFTTYEKVDARKKIYKEFAKKYTVISTNNLSRNDLMIKVRDFFYKNKYKVDHETLQYILNSCGNNYDLIYNEIQKICLYYNYPTNILLDDAKEIISKTLLDNNFKFIDAVIYKDYSLALQLLEDLYTLKVDPITLIMLLAREYRLIYSVQILLRTGLRKNEIGKKLGLQEWQMEKFIKESGSYYEETLEEILKKLSLVDYKIKSGKGDKYLELSNFLLSIL